MAKSQHKKGDVEGSRSIVLADDALSCPRMITRIWGMVVAIAYISTGSSLMVNSTEKKCRITGTYMLGLGIILLFTECPCCLLAIRPGNKLCDLFEKYCPFWVKGLLFMVKKLKECLTLSKIDFSDDVHSLLTSAQVNKLQKLQKAAASLLFNRLMLPPVILCFHWKTMLVALTMIILAILYFFLTCLQGSKKYERLRGEINHELNRKREQVSATYNSLNYATATVNAFESATRKSQFQKGKVKPHAAVSKKTQKKTRV